MSLVYIAVCWIMASNFSNPICVPVGHLLVNPKWRGSELVSFLQAKMKIMYNEDEGSVVDFYPSQDTGIVIVTEADQVAGNAYKRKLAKLRKTQAVQGIVLAERTTTSTQYFRGVQDFTVLELGLKVIPVESMDEAARLIIQIAHVESTGSSPNPLRIKRKGPTIDSTLLATVKLIPGLGAVKAKLLLEKFESLMGIVNASEKESTAVSVRSFLLKTPESRR